MLREARGETGFLAVSRKKILAPNNQALFPLFPLFPPYTAYRIPPSPFFSLHQPQRKSLGNSVVSIMSHSSPSWFPEKNTHLS